MRLHLLRLFIVGGTTILLCLPFLRTVYWLGDEGILLNGAIRVLHGQALYKDFFEFIPPGGFILTEGWLALVGKSLVSVRILTIILLTCVTCFTYLASYRASRFGFLSAALPIFWIVISQGVWTQLSHHWISLPLAMVTIWATFAYLAESERRLGWALIAGFTAGAAGIVTQTVGATVALVAFTAFVDRRPDWKGLLAYLASCAFVPVAVISYVAFRGNLFAAINDIIIFPSQHYSAIQWVPWGYGLNHRNAPVAFLFPVLLALVAADVMFNWRARLRERIYLTGVLFTLGGLALCFPRPGVNHIAKAAPFAFPLMCMIIGRIWARMSGGIRTLIKVLGVVVAIYPAIALRLTIVHALHQPSTWTPRGRVKFFRHPGIERLVETIAASPKGQTYFFYPYEPTLYYLTGRMNISSLGLFVPHYTTPKQYKETCLSVMRDATWIVVSTNWTLEKWKRSFPAIKSFNPPETVAFQHAINTGFRQVHQIGVYDLLHRTGAATPTLCNDINQRKGPQS